MGNYISPRCQKLIVDAFKGWVCPCMVADNIAEEAGAETKPTADPKQVDEMKIAAKKPV